MFLRSSIIPLHKTTRLARRLAQPFSKHNLRRAAHTLWPSILALSFAGVAHAQGTMDFSGATTLMTTFKTTVLQSVREGAEKSGYTVEGFAPTSRAAAQLHEAGIDA